MIEHANCRLIVSAGFALAVAVGGCGVKGQPLPAEAVRPERILNLEANPDQAGIKLSWGRPERYAKGRTMRDLAGFVILRAEGNQPLRPLAEVPIADRERFQKQHRFDYVDATTEMGRSYRYVVVSMTDDGYGSEPSNLVELTRIVPQPPPSPENFALPNPTPLR